MVSDAIPLFFCFVFCLFVFVVVVFVVVVVVFYQRLEKGWHGNRSSENTVKQTCFQALDKKTTRTNRSEVVSFFSIFNRLTVV